MWKRSGARLAEIIKILFQKTDNYELQAYNPLVWMAENGEIKGFSKEHIPDREVTNLEIITGVREWPEGWNLWIFLMLYDRIIKIFSELTGLVMVLFGHGAPERKKQDEGGSSHAG